MERYHPGTAQGGLRAPDGQQTLDLGCFLGEIVKIMVSSQQHVLDRAGWWRTGSRSLDHMDARQVRSHWLS